MVYEETRFILRDFLTRAVRDAIVYSGKSHLQSPPAPHGRIELTRVGSAAHCNRKTVRTIDVIYALKLQGRTLYYF